MLGELNKVAVFGTYKEKTYLCKNKNMYVYEKDHHPFCSSLGFRNNGLR